MDETEIRLFGTEDLNQDRYQNIIATSLKELADFFRCTPKTVEVYFHKNRSTFDSAWGSKTQNWMVGYHKENTTQIHLLHPSVYEELSIHQFSEEDFARIIQHELGHLFVSLISPKCPYLFNEGFALYLSKFYMKEKVVSKIKERGKMPDFETLFFFEFDYLASSFAALLMEMLSLEQGHEKLKEFMVLLSEKDYPNAFRGVYDLDFCEYYPRFMAWLTKK